METTTTPIAEAVKPMRDPAVAAAEAAVLAKVESLAARLAAADWNLDAVAPRGKLWTANYQAAQRLRDFVTALFETDQARSGVTRRPGDPVFVKRSEERVARTVEMAREQAAAQFDAYVAKLEHKVGDVLEAVVCDRGSLWEHSTLRVTKADGSVEFWRTQRILNFSRHGLPYHQWPTRKVKGVAA